MSQTRFYRHYKNKPYKYLGTVRHSETLEELALYETLYENEHSKVWVRPKEMFFENVEINGAKRARFEKIHFDFQMKQSLNEKEWISIKEIFASVFGVELKEEKLQSKLAAHPRWLFLLVYEKEKLLGFKIGYALNDSMFYSWIGGVLSEYRSLGLSSELMRRQHQWCRENGFKSVETRSRNQFFDMLRLNIKFGFEITGFLPDERGGKIIFQKKLT